MEYNTNMFWEVVALLIAILAVAHSYYRGIVQDKRNKDIDGKQEKLSKQLDIQSAEQARTRILSDFNALDIINSRLVHKYIQIQKLCAEAAPEYLDS